MTIFRDSVLSVSIYKFNFSIALEPTAASLAKDKFWQALTDFSHWAEWLPHALTIELPDAPPPGRGTRLLVHSKAGLATWQVSYWDQGKRLVFQIENANKQRQACAIEIRGTATDAEVLNLEFEFELQGWRRLLAPFLGNIYARHAKLLGAALQAWLQLRLQ